MNWYLRVFLYLITFPILGTAIQLLYPLPTFGWKWWLIRLPLALAVWSFYGALGSKLAKRRLMNQNTRELQQKTVVTLDEGTSPENMGQPHPVSITETFIYNKPIPPS